MARLGVGQRARFVSARVPEGIPYIGSEVLIVAGKQPIGRSPYNGRNNPCEADFLVEHYDGKIALVDAWQLEPIVDPGREVIAWSECVWKPEHLRTEA